MLGRCPDWNAAGRDFPEATSRIVTLNLSLLGKLP
jgi:hypothetical protein